MSRHEPHRAYDKPECGSPQSARWLAAVLSLCLLLASCARDAASDQQTIAENGEASASSERSDLSDAQSPVETPGATTPAPIANTPGRLVDATSELGIDTALVGVRGHAVASADVNNDGFPDLFVGTFADRPLDTYQVRGATGPAPDRLLLGGPDGFMVDESFTPPLGRAAGAHFADLDNDGDPDLIVSRNVRDDQRADAPTEIYQNVDGALVATTILDDDRGGRAVGTIDYDGDGLLDIVLVEDRWSGGSSALFRNTGDLQFVETTSDAGLPTDIFGLGLGIGDLDGDGLEDLVFGGSNRVFLGASDGFIEAEASPLPWPLNGDEDDPAHVLLLDANDDGNLDIAIGQHFNSTLDSNQPQPIRLFLNNGGTGRDIDLEDATQELGITPMQTKSPQLVALDLDADGRDDIVTTASTGDFTPVVLTASGTSQQPIYESSAIEVGPHYWIDAVTLDANGDGRLDIFFVEWEPSLGSRLFLNMPLEP